MYVNKVYLSYVYFYLIERKFWFEQNTRLTCFTLSFGFETQIWASCGLEANILASSDLDIKILASGQMLGLGLVTLVSASTFWPQFEANRLAATSFKTKVLALSGLDT